MISALTVQMLTLFYKIYWQVFCIMLMLWSNTFIIASMDK